MGLRKSNDFYITRKKMLTESPAFCRNLQGDLDGLTWPDTNQKNIIFYSPMTFKDDFRLPGQCARTITCTPSSACPHRLSLAVPKVPSPLIGITFTITP